MNAEREASMSRHPAGKGRAVVHSSTSEGDDTTTPVVREVATVTVLKAVDGTKKRRQRSDKGKRRSLSELHTEVKVDPRVMNAARRVIAQGVYTRLTIVDAETVVIR